MDKLLVSEKRVWFTIDQLLVMESTIGGNQAKCEAFEAVLGYLEAPTPEECRILYREVNP